MSKLTKIIASIGPNSQDYKILKSMLEHGVDACRLNFSHDTGEVQGKKIDMIRKISAELDRPIAIIADLQGPKHRIGDFKTENHYPLKVGQEFILDNNPERGDETRVCLPDSNVLKSLKVGDRVLLNDGKIELEVLNNSCTVDSTFCSVTTKVKRGDEIWSRRGFNIPDTEIESSILTPKDRADLEYVLTKNPDWVAISFVQRPEDVAEARDFITAHSSAPVKIISKIERPQALEKLEEIIQISDAIMFARGDLAVEVPFEKLPALQRRCIRLCRKMNKPVIVATQMLSSMVHSEFPLRAEISDVALASYLRADCVMTSEETTIGDNPVNVIDTMMKILVSADEDVSENGYDWSRTEHLPENDWSRSVASLAYLNKAQAIVAFDTGTEIATPISGRKPDVTIIVVCNDAIDANQLCLSRGVYPVFDAQLFGQRDAFGAAKRLGINRGKLVVVDENKISLREISE
ncbi:MAG: pyruvate kinase [Alphaproteobacteria bacterium]|nr:pyruvate kinase [Alphaproteobacteria bacterium]